MKNKTRNSALAFAGLKATQQVMHDLESVVLDNTKPDFLLYYGEQICRMGAPIAGAYALDNAISHAEEALPKYIRGLIPLAAATLGVAAAINYQGDWFGIQEGVGLIPTTIQLLKQYQENLGKAITFNPSVHAGYLGGCLLALQSGVRFAKNLGQELLEKGRKRQRHREIKDTRRDEE